MAEKPTTRNRKGVHISPQEAKFIMLYVYGLDGKHITQHRCYREAYPRACEKLSPAAIDYRANQLITKPKITRRITELRNALAVAAGITREREIEKLEALYDIAVFGRMDVAKDEQGNTQYVNPDAGPDELKIPMVRTIKSNLSAAVRIRELIAKHAGLFDGKAGMGDIPSFEERWEKYRHDPPYTPPPVDDTIRYVDIEPPKEVKGNGRG